MRAPGIRFLQLERVEDRLTPAAFSFPSVLVSPPVAVPAIVLSPDAVTRAASSHSGDAHPDLRDLHSVLIDVRVSLNDSSGDANPDPFAPLHASTSIPLRPADLPIAPAADVDRHPVSRDRSIDLPPIEDSPVLLQQRVSAAPAAVRNAPTISLPGAAAYHPAPSNSDWTLLPGVRLIYKGRLLPLAPQVSAAVPAAPSEAEPEADVPSAEEGTLPASELPLDAFISLFPAGVPLAGAIAANLPSIEEAANALLANLPDLGGDDVFSDPERYLWLGAATLVGASTAFAIRPQRAASADRVVLGADFIRMIPKPQRKTKLLESELPRVDANSPR